MTRVRLPARPPFRFDFGLEYLARSQEEILDVVEDGVHRRVIAGARGPALIEIRPAAVNGGGGVEAVTLAGEVAPDALAAFVRHQYRLDDDRSSLPNGDSLSAPLLDHFAGLPLMQTGSPFEALIWAVLGQQINVAFAYQLKRRFVEQFGEQVHHDGRTYYAFPDPVRVATLSHERDLRPLQFSRQKSRYATELAQAVLDGRLDFDEIAELDDEAALQSLQAHVGVGRWTAEYVLLRGFGRRDVIPAADAGLRAALCAHLGLTGNASEAQVREIGEHWRPYRGELAFLIWFSLQHGWFHKKPKGV